MPQDVSAVITGTGVIYIAPESVAIPTLTGNATDFNAFDSPGYTMDGIEVDYSATDKAIVVDEESFPVDVLIDKETSSINVKLAQTTMQNLYYSMTGATLTGGDTVTFGGKLNPDKFRVGFIGPSPAANKVREILFFRTYAKSALKLTYKRNGQVVYQCQFMALADSTQPAGSRAGIYKDF